MVAKRRCGVTGCEERVKGCRGDNRDATMKGVVLDCKSATRERGMGHQEVEEGIKIACKCGRAIHARLKLTE